MPKPEIFTARLPTEEEAQATRECAKIALQQLRKIGSQKDTELASRETARNSPSEEPSLEPELVRRYRTAVEELHDGRGQAGILQSLQGRRAVGGSLCGTNRKATINRENRWLGTLLPGASRAF